MLDSVYLTDNNMAEANFSPVEEIIFRCVVPQCQSRDVSAKMFRIPKNEKIAKVWRELIFRPEKTDWKEARLCRNHFRERDYFEHNGQLYLLDSARPGFNIPDKEYRESVLNCLNRKTEVVLVDTKINPGNDLFCFLCRAYCTSGKRIMERGRYTEFGKELLYLIRTRTRYHDYSDNVCCKKCADKVEETIMKILNLIVKFIRTTMIILLSCDFCPVPNCYNQWDQDDLKAAAHFKKHLLSCWPFSPVLKALTPSEFPEPFVFGEHNHAVVRFQIEHGKWHPYQSRYIREHAKEQQEIRETEPPMPGERLNCCICGNPRGEFYYTLIDSPTPTGLCDRIFEIVNYGSEFKSSRYNCENCNARLLDVFGDYVYLTNLARLALRRTRGESLQYALRLGCFRLDCDYVPSNLYSLCSHMSGHF